MEVLKTRYAEEIREAYVECEHEGEIDFQNLSLKLNVLKGRAKIEGLALREFEDIVHSELPKGIVGQIGIISSPAA